MENVKLLANLDNSAASHGFTVISKDELPEIDGLAVLMQHKASGARLLYLANDDSNKAFSIAFKTPAADDTGVFHILEHSVLCGSDKFPVKEPFVNLLKSSMQTFLNALTFPDKTVYPVASTNEQDLLNLADVYMDAVFHPKIYEKQAIFEQEGWHIELNEPNEEDVLVAAMTGETPDAMPGVVSGATVDPSLNTLPDTPHCSSRLRYNGVVYNEMKGVLSSPEAVLADTLMAALFPDTTYRFESGGTPCGITTLTYEQFLETHRRHYHPKNSYITLYGNLDIDKFLGFLDDEYLAAFATLDKSTEDSTFEIFPLDLQKPVCNTDVVKRMATSPDNACAAAGFVIGTSDERERTVAASILFAALMGSNEAPLKRAILDAGIGKDTSCSVEDSLIQPFVTIDLQGVACNDADNDGTGERDAHVSASVKKLLDIIRTTAADLAIRGIDRDLLLAEISNAEFSLREQDFGEANGVVYAVSALSSWLYNDDKPIESLRFEDMFAEFREKLNQGYFENLLDEIILQNDHFALVEIVPSDGDEEAQVDARLTSIEQKLSPDDLESIEKNAAALLEAQNTPDSPEDLKKLPQLQVSDIGAAPHEGDFSLADDTPVPCLRHNIATRGIDYVNRYYDLSGISFDELSYIAILGMLLGKLDTSAHSAAELNTLIKSKLGNMNFFSDVFPSMDDPNKYRLEFIVTSSALTENVDYLATIANEVLYDTDFSDDRKIFDILKQRLVSFEQAFLFAGHQITMNRARSYFLPSAVVREQLSGIDFYFFLRDLCDNFEERKDRLIENIRSVSQRIFCETEPLISFTGNDEDLGKYWCSDDSRERTLHGSTDANKRLIVPEPVDRHEAFVVPTDVSFSAASFDARRFGNPEGGLWGLCAQILSLGYLWDEVRVKGGAYGTGCVAAVNGITSFYSFRDPQIAPTIESFRSAGEWLASYTPTSSEFDGYIISATAGIDAPIKPRELIIRQDRMYFTGYTPVERLRRRENVLNAKPADVQSLSSIFAQARDRMSLCTLARRDMVEASDYEFTIVELLDR